MLQGLPCGTVYVPAIAAEAFHALMTAHERLEGFRYDYRIEGMAPGSEVALRRNLRVRAHEASHRIPANAYEVVEIRNKLKGELVGRSSTEIARLRTETGAIVTEEYEQSLLFYTGDTDREIFQTSHQMFHSSVLMIECSFTAEGERERARRYRHIHLEDLYDVADLFHNELIVLTHFSLRDDPKEIHKRVSMGCPRVLRERIRLGLPEPFVKL
jgi:ribonuclease Z